MAVTPPVESLAESIDDVVDRLTTTVDWSRHSRSRLGYFAALYRKVTIRVRDGIEQGHFADGERMARFDVIFANRYLQALIDLRQGRRPGRVWGVAFDAAQAYWPIVLQHLLLGMNAHINLDLGIAAAQTMRGRRLEDLHADFNLINGILASIVDDVQTELGRIWITQRVFNSLLGRADDVLIEFSMTKARDEAWRSATQLSAIPEAEWPQAMSEQDERMLHLARLVRRPGIVLNAATRAVRIGELADESRVIDILS